MIAGLDTGYRNYIQMKQPNTYSEATHALLLKEAVNPPSDVMKDVLKTVQAIHQNQTTKGNRNADTRRMNDNQRNYQQEPQKCPKLS